MENINQLFVENIYLIMMCKNIISRDNELSGCIVSQPGFIEAPLGAYLDFWFNYLPYSTDEEYQPLCAISYKECFAKKDKSCEIIRAKLNAPIEDVVEVFNKCKARHISCISQISLYDAMSKIWELMISEETDHSALVGWQQFYLPAKLSSLENRYIRLLREVHRLENVVKKILNQNN